MGLLLEEYAGKLSPQQRQYLQSAYDGNERQLTVMNDLLKTAQLDSENVMLKKQPHNIYQLVVDSLSAFQSFFELRKQKVVFECEDKDISARIDCTEITLAMTNLIENASKYTYPGKHIKVHINRQNKNVQITVSDEGVGILKKNMKTIFDKFTTIDNDLSDTVNGSGLGLYLVKRIVTLHGGTIKVTSELNKGSSFMINLPL